MKKSIKILGIIAGICICIAVAFIGGCTMGLNFGTSVTAQANAKMATILMPRVSMVSLDSDLITQNVSIMGSGVVILVSAVRGPDPDRLVVDYAHSDTGKVLGTETVYTKTNNAGAKYLELSIPDYGHLVTVKIHRP